MNPLGSNANLWGSWSWNESNEEEGIAKNNISGNWVYPSGNPPEKKADDQIIDWPSVDFGD